MEWQPIETAPGRAELPSGALVWDGKHRSIAFPVDHSDRRWWVDEYANEVEPTHWMPLPAPPLERGDAR